MRPSLPVAALALLFAVCTTLNAAEPIKKPTGVEAEAAAAKWYNGLDEEGLVIDETVKEGGFTVSHAPSALGRITKFSFENDGWWISVAFRGEHSAETSRETLQKNFWYVALDRVPTPGLDLPGWEVRPRTPTSSISSGVQVLSYGDGKIKLQVKTSFFALYGRDPSVLVPADASSPPGSYFMIRKKVPFDLTIEAPFVFK